MEGNHSSSTFWQARGEFAAAVAAAHAVGMLGLIKSLWRG
jgi:hypothetical protein